MQCKKWNLNGGTIVYSLHKQRKNNDKIFVPDERIMIKTCFCKDNRSY